MGYSTNATVVIYDRIRENAGYHGGEMTPSGLADLSVSQTLTRCIITGATVLICMTVVFVLTAGNGLESITHFALPMITGTIAGCFSSICLTSTSWAWWLKFSQKRIKMREQSEARQVAALKPAARQDTAKKEIDSKPAENTETDERQKPEERRKPDASPKSVAKAKTPARKKSGKKKNTGGKK